MYDREGRTAFTCAVQRGDLDAVAASLDAGVDPDSRSVLGEPALCLAAARGDTDLIALLLDRGASVDKTTDQDNAPLMEAVARGHYDAATLLLDRGADVSHANKWGQTARDWAKWAPAESEVIGLIVSRTAE